MCNIHSTAINVTTRISKKTVGNLLLSEGYEHACYKLGCHLYHNTIVHVSSDVTKHGVNEGIIVVGDVSNDHLYM